MHARTQTDRQTDKHTHVHTHTHTETAVHRVSMHIPLLSLVILNGPYTCSLSELFQEPSDVYDEPASLFDWPIPEEQRIRTKEQEEKKQKMKTT